MVAAPKVFGASRLQFSNTRRRHARRYRIAVAVRPYFYDPAGLGTLVSTESGISCLTLVFKTVQDLRPQQKSC